MAAVNRVSPAPAAGGPSRRERVRAATRSELTDAARSLLRSGGVEAVTVRSIASALGMTAPAIYRYFDSREALLQELVNELYDELATHLYAVRASAESKPLEERFMLQSWAFRQWALDHRAEFGLLFGAPIPGVGDDDSDSRGQRFGQVWLDLFIELASQRGPLTWPHVIPPALRRQMDTYLDRIGRPVEVDTALHYLAAWERLYGAVCTEVFGHLGFALDNGEELFADQLNECGQRLGLRTEEPGRLSARAASGTTARQQARRSRDKDTNSRTRQ